MQSGERRKHQRMLEAQQENATNDRPAGANPPGRKHWSTVEREKIKMSLRNYIKTP